jgi:hypothetical protein
MSNTGDSLKRQSVYGHLIIETQRVCLIGVVSNFEFQQCTCGILNLHFRHDNQECKAYQGHDRQA